MLSVASACIRGGGLNGGLGPADRLVIPGGVLRWGPGRYDMAHDEDRSPPPVVSTLARGEIRVFDLLCSRGREALGGLRVDLEGILGSGFRGSGVCTDSSESDEVDQFREALPTAGPIRADLLVR